MCLLPVPGLQPAGNLGLRGTRPNPTRRERGPSSGLTTQCGVTSYRLRFVNIRPCHTDLSSYDAGDVPQGSAVGTASRRFREAFDKSFCSRFME